MSDRRKPVLHYFSFDSLGNPWVSGGGAVRDLEILSRWTDRADITLFTGAYPGFRPRRERGVRIRALGFGASNALSRATFTLSANAYALLSGADILGFSPSIFAPVLAGACRSGRSYAVLHHSVGRASREKYGWTGLLFEGIEYLLFRTQRRWAVSNSAVLERIRQVQPEADLFLTRNGIDPALLALKPQPVERPYILYLGRFDIPMKGLDLLVQAYSLAQRRTALPGPLPEGGVPGFPDLVLAGRATSEQLLQLQAAVPEPLRSRVRLLTHVDEAAKRELLRGCLFFCSPSRFEGFGIAALEAQAAGKAVLATRVDGFLASLDEGRTAKLIPPGSADGLADALLEFTRDPERCSRYGAAGRVWASGFSWDAIAEREWEWVQSP